VGKILDTWLAVAHGKGINREGKPSHHQAKAGAIRSGFCYGWSIIEQTM
jgi:hypothetical protein